jgi:6,7-dimethyl-8-ribityllumazine synthase
MASNLKHLGNTEDVKKEFDLSGKKVGIVVSHYHRKVTEALVDGAKYYLNIQGVKDIEIKEAPGAFELPLGAAYLLESCDAVVAIGCVIQGETPHFDFICQAVAQGTMQLNLETKKPVAFGLITTLNLDQALDRAGGKHGNKGVEAARAVAGMLAF